MPRLRRRNRNNAMAISKRARRIFSRARFCFWTGGIFLLCGVILLSGCVRHEPPADVTIINGGEPESLDPAIITGQVEMRIVQGLFEGLTRLDPKTGPAHPRSGGGLGNFTRRPHLHIPSADQSDLVHRRTDYRRRRGLFVDSGARIRRPLPVTRDSCFI